MGPIRDDTVRAVEKQDTLMEAAQKCAAIVSAAWELSNKIQGRLFINTTVDESRKDSELYTIEEYLKFIRYYGETTVARLEEILTNI